MRKLAGLIGVVLILGLLALFAGQWVQRSLVAAGVQQLDWQQVRWHDGSLQLGQVSVVHVSEQGRVAVGMSEVQLRPVWRGGPRIEQLLIDELRLVWQPAEQLPSSDTEQPPSTLPSLADLAEPMEWLPQRLEISQLRVQLPCEDAFCTLQGSFELDSQQQPLNLNAELDLQAQGQKLTGRVQLQEQADRYLLQAGLQLPESLPLAGLGQLSGNIELDLENRGDQWLLHQGHATARLEQPQLDMLTTVPVEWHPSSLALEITPQPGSLADWQDSLLLAVQLDMEGAIAGQLQGELALSSTPQWQAELSEAQLRMSAERLAMSAVQLQGIELDWPVHALINAQHLDLALGEKAPLTIKRLALAGDEVVMTGVQGQLGKTSLMVPLDSPGQLTLTSPLQLGVQQLQQAALKPQGWHLQGDLEQSASGLRFDGNLAALSGLDSHVQLNRRPDQPWQLQVTLADIFLRAANPLMATFADWPALLSFSSGRVSGQLQASGNDSLQQLTGQLSLSGGEGIYDRTHFSGLSLPLDISLQRDRLRLSTDALALNSLDPGLPLGPLRVNGSYNATLGQLADGVIELSGARLGVLDGEVQLEPASIHLGLPRQSLVAVVEGVELARLFEVYPAEGLSGQGTLDGRFPVSLVNGKLLIEEGQLQARQPGGVLRYQTQKLRELAASNPNLEQLTVVLDDFHYGVLTSDVAYDEQGVLLLGLRLQGSNPAFQQGRQVNLNIQLEEDIPALLTSLQLSGQVNEIIRKRVEQYYLQRRNP